MAELLSLSYIAIGALALLWKFSDLPKADWKMIAAGAMLMLVASMIGPIAVDLMTLGLTINMGLLVAILNLIGGLLVVIGGLQNALKHLK